MAQQICRQQHRLVEIGAAQARRQVIKITEHLPLVARKIRQTRRGAAFHGDHVDEIVRAERVDNFLRFDHAALAPAHSPIAVLHAQRVIEQNNDVPGAVFVLVGTEHLPHRFEKHQHQGRDRQRAQNRQQQVPQPEQPRALRNGFLDLLNRRKGKRLGKFPVEEMDQKRQPDQRRKQAQQRKVEKGHGRGSVAGRGQRLPGV